MLLILKWMKQSTRTTGVVQSLDASEGTSSLSKSHSPRWTSTKPYLHSSTSVLSGGCFFHGLLFHFVAYLCMRAAYPPAWTPVDVTSDFDLTGGNNQTFGTSQWCLVLAVLSVTSSLSCTWACQTGHSYGWLASPLPLKSLIATKI